MPPAASAAEPATSTAHAAGNAGGPTMAARSADGSSAADRRAATTWCRVERRATAADMKVAVDQPDRNWAGLVAFGSERCEAEWGESCLGVGLGCGRAEIG